MKCVKSVLLGWFYDVHFELKLNWRDESNFGTSF